MANEYDILGYVNKKSNQAVSLFDQCDSLKEDLERCFNTNARPNMLSLYDFVSRVQELLRK